MNAPPDPFYDDYFSRMIDVLELLCAPAPEQCEVMDSYNTGWELRQDTVDMIEAVVTSSSSALCLSQVELLRTVQSMAARLPPDAINAQGKNMQTREGCEAVMRHPAWSELRQYTPSVLEALQVVTLLHRGKVRDGS